jgi:hypothetical protein
VDPTQQPIIPPAGLPPIAPPPGGPRGGPPPQVQAFGQTRKAHVAAATFTGCTDWTQGKWQGWPYLWTFECYYAYDPVLFGGPSAVEGDVFFYNPSDNLYYYWFYYYTAVG